MRPIPFYIRVFFPVILFYIIFNNFGLLFDLINKPGPVETINSINIISTKNPIEPARIDNTQLSFLGLEPIGPIEPPPFTLDTIRGGKISLSDYKGKVVFLNFWATWCPPCISELPDMNKVYNELKDEGFVVIALNDYEDPERVRKFLAERKLDFIIPYDQSGHVSESYNAVVLPSTFIIDKNGMAIAKATGLRDWSAPEYVKFFRGLLND